MYAGIQVYTGIDDYIYINLFTPENNQLSVRTGASLYHLRVLFGGIL